MKVHICIYCGKHVEANRAGYRIKNPDTGHYTRIVHMACHYKATRGKGKGK